jgi:hypothetical protein
MLNPIREAMCPACGYHVAAEFYHGGEQPLATLAWPATAAEARTMARLPLDFVRCVDCGHVYNSAFDYRAVPYSEKPYGMYNRGQIWSGYIRRVQAELDRMLPPSATVVEIGYGDGSFLTTLAERETEGAYIGFDPHGSEWNARSNLSFRQELFTPGRHIPELRPDLMVSRHVLEHLTNPLGFLQTINFAAASANVQVLMYFEVPCVDHAIARLRTADFYYEHNSQFTSQSFRRMLERSGVEIHQIGFGYEGEVIHAFVRTKPAASQLETAASSTVFLAAAEGSRKTIALQLASLFISGRTVAIWGGTGKAAAFMNRHGIDALRFPIVIDSDPHKAGTFVPGTGQEIRFRDWLLDHPAAVILIPPQWRAADIVREMESAGIAPAKILIEHEGRLIDYFTDSHPYRVPDNSGAREAEHQASVNHRHTAVKRAGIAEPKSVAAGR